MRWKNSFDRMIDPSDSDRLHQSDWSAQRIGQTLCAVIVDAVESNPDLSFAQGTQCRETQRNRTRAWQLQEKVRRRSARLAFSRWAIAQLEVYRIPNIR